MIPADGIQNFGTTLSFGDYLSFFVADYHRFFRGLRTHCFFLKIPFVTVFGSCDYHGFLAVDYHRFSRPVEDRHKPMRATRNSGMGSPAR